MAEYLSPGVYVEEFDSGAVPMATVSTSTAGFIGVTEKGPQKGAPVLVTNFASFRRIFGGELSENEFGEYRYLAYAVNQFFLNGGSRCYIKRVVPKNAMYAHNVDNVVAEPFVVYAKNPGSWGDRVKLTVTPASKGKTQILSVIDTGKVMKYKTKNATNFLAGDIVVLLDGGVKIYNKVLSVDGNILTFALPFEESAVDTALIPERVLMTCEVDIEVACDNQMETFELCSFNENSPNFLTQKLGKSDIVFADAKIQNEIIDPFTLISGKEDGTHTIDLYGGYNGTQGVLSVADYIGVDEGPNERTGIQSFIDNTEVSIMAISGITDPQVQLNLVAHCELMTNRFAILDIPRDKKTVDDVMAHRNFFDSEYAAMYHPWVKVSDPLTKNPLAIPPTGSIAGIYARTDTARGVHKAPANEVVNACVALDCNYTTGEQDVLNPKGVNLIRSLPGQGIRVWGARTVSSNAMWRYINVRRLFIFVEESIRTSTNWVVFEPNDQLLWLRVRRTIEIFLGNIWRTGALAGSTEDEAFFVDIGPNTMTQGDIDAGRLICVIGIAPTKPAEFVIFRITQKTSDSGAE